MHAVLLSLSLSLSIVMAAELPIVFESNHGQTHPDVHFLARGQRLRAYFSPDQAMVLARDQDRRWTRFSISAFGTAASLRPEEPRGGRSHYIRETASTTAAHFGRLRYEAVQPGIDLVFYAQGPDLEFDFVVAPGADTGRIQFRIEGSGPPALANGEVVAGAARLKPPIAYQEEAGRRTPVPVRYVLNGGTVGFAVGRYDRRRPLVIDPVVNSTYLGGRDVDLPSAVTTDVTGSIYVTGTTASTDFPVSASPFKGTLGAGDSDAFVVKLNAGATAILWATYIGGPFADYAKAIAVDTAGAAYLTGLTIGRFPVTVGAYRELPPQAPAIFVAKVHPAGILLEYSTYLDGAGAGQAITVDSTRNAYIAGHTYSAGFTTTAGSLQPVYSGSTDAFVFKLNPTGTGAVYSTFLGGRGEDQAAGIAVDPGGSAFVTGFTSSSDFPVSTGAYRTSYAGAVDAFVTKLNPAGSALMYSTFLGSSSIDRASAIAVDPAGNAYIAGQTYSAGFPTTAGAFDTTFSGGSADAFVTKLNSIGTALLYSTFLGGAGGCSIADPYRMYNCDGAFGVALEGSTVWVAGIAGPGFPVVGGGQAAVSGLSDAFVAQISGDGSGLLYSALVGGSGNEVAHAMTFSAQSGPVAIGVTGSSDLPLAAGAIQTTARGDIEGFLTRVGSCSATFGSSTAYAPATAGSYSVPVVADPGCAWTATSNAGWLTLTSASGSGNGSVLFNVAQNTTGARSAQISIGAEIFTLNQLSGLCVSLGYSSIWFGQPGGTHSFPVYATCAWSASTTAPWITITSGTGTGNGQVNYTAAANNTGTIRTGEINVSGMIFTVNQIGGPGGISCTYTLSRATDLFDHLGGSSSLLVTAGQGCPWSISNPDPWISITTGPVGAGTGVVGYTVHPNSTAQTRSGAIVIQGQVLSIFQLAP